MSKSIPDRWIPYKAYGKVIEGTRIVCFKVPLRKGVQEHNKAIKEIWDIKTLLDTLPKLGAVVDLTNTARYYNPGELRDAGVLHKKIFMPGRVIPPENKVTEFMDTIDEFLGKDCDIIIGVHCTHGLNRTGYMVCRYMRDRLGIQAEDAITRFEEARGYKIERENYIADLLGKEVPPPDVGKRETMVIPLDDQAEGSEHILKARTKNRWRNNNRSHHNNQPESDTLPDNDNRPGYDNRPGHYNRPRYDNRSGYNNRPRYNNRSRNDNQRGFDNRPGSDQPGHDNRYGERSMQFRSPLDQPGTDNRPGPENRYRDRSMHYRSPLDEPGSDNRPESDNRQGTDNRYRDRSMQYRSPLDEPGSDIRSESDNRSGLDNRYRDKSMQYRSPLDQSNDTESHPEGQSNGYRRRFNYNPYNRNRNDTQRNDASDTSGKSSSRWDMSGMAHRPRKDKE